MDFYDSLYQITRTKSVFFSCFPKATKIRAKSST